MKKIYSAVFAFFPLFCLSQKVINPFFRPSMYATKGHNGFGGAIGIGFKENQMGMGGTFEVISLSKQAVIPLHADVRFYFSKNNTSPYITFQPGYNFRSNSTSTTGITVKDKGGVYAGIGVGLYSFPKRPGFTFQVKYVFMSDKRETIYNYGSGYSFGTGYSSVLTKQNFVSAGLYLVI